MNFLGHALLSGEDEDLFVGNFCGDFVKGKQYKNYPPRIAQGILLHRSIDAYTDDHSAVKGLRQLLAPKYRHYSGILVDVFFDHFLASNWSEFHDQPLEEYSLECYVILEQNFDQLPAGMQYVLPYMKKGNWLLHYAELSGIKRALSGLSRRTKFTNNMDQGHLDLKENYSRFKVFFDQFMPDILAYVAHWKLDNPISQ